MKKEHNELENQNFENSTKKFFDKKTLGLLTIIGIIGLIIRLYYAPFDLPIILDGSAYFFYANDMSILGKFPHDHQFPNNGWPAFLSIFFSILQSDNFLDYMGLQRILSIILSTVTIIPTYLLCRRFIGKFYSVIGASLFVLEPRIIINSVLGITEASYFLLGITSLFFFLSKNMKIIYLSFAIAGLFALVRYEGLLILIPFSIMFFIRFRKRKNIINYFVAIGIFVLIISPMIMIRMDTTGQDGFVSHYAAGMVAHSNISQYPENEENDGYYFQMIISTIIEFIKFGGWVMIPTFIFFMIMALILILKRKYYRKIDHNKLTIIMFGIFMSIPALYAFSRDLPETRYLYILFPIFCLLSYYGIQFFDKKIQKRKLLFTIILAAVIISSIAYIENKGLNLDESQEQYQLAKLISEKTDGINPYSGQEYIKIEQISNTGFPVLKNKIIENPKIVPIGNTTSLKDFIHEGRNNQLSHIVIDKHGTSQPEFFSKLYLEHDKISYLDLELDSKELGFKKELKLFRINYEIFDSNQKDLQ